MLQANRLECPGDCGRPFSPTTSLFLSLRYFFLILGSHICKDFLLFIRGFLSLFGCLNVYTVCGGNLKHEHVLHVLSSWDLVDYLCSGETIIVEIVKEFLYSLLHHNPLLVICMCCVQLWKIPDTTDYIFPFIFQNILHLYVICSAMSRWSSYSLTSLNL